MLHIRRIIHEPKRTYQEIPFEIVDDVVLVDDASRDDTPEVARKLVRFPDRRAQLFDQIFPRSIFNQLPAQRHLRTGGAGDSTFIPPLPYGDSARENLSLKREHHALS